MFDLPGECDTLFSVLAAIEDALTSLCPGCMPEPRLTKQCLPFKHQYIKDSSRSLRIMKIINSNMIRQISQFEDFCTEEDPVVDDQVV